MEFGPSQSPAPTPPRPLHRWANEGRGLALCWRNCTGGRIQLGHGHYAHPIWMGARGWARSAHNGGWVPLERHLFGREGGVPTVQVALSGLPHQLCSWVWLGQATQWWVGPSDTT